MTETVATFAELYACHSDYTVHPANIEMYTVELLGDEESAEMMELIFDNITFDPGYLWWSNYETDLGNMIASGKNNVTQWAGRKGTDVQKKIDEFMTSLLDNKN